MRLVQNYLRAAGLNLRSIRIDPTKIKQKITIYDGGHKQWAPFKS